MIFFILNAITVSRFFNKVIITVNITNDMFSINVQAIFSKIYDVLKILVGNGMKLETFKSQKPDQSTIQSSSTLLLSKASKQRL